MELPTSAEVKKCVDAAIEKTFKVGTLGSTVSVIRKDKGANIRYEVNLPLD